MLTVSFCLRSGKSCEWCTHIKQGCTLVKGQKSEKKKRGREEEDMEKAARKKQRTEIEETDDADVGKLVRLLHREMMERITGLEMTMEQRMETYDRRAERRVDMAKKKTDKRMREVLTQLKMVCSRADIALDILEREQAEREKRKEKEDEVDGDGVTDRGTPQRGDSEGSDDEAEATLRDAVLETLEETGEKVDDGGEQSEEE